MTLAEKQNVEFEKQAKKAKILCFVEVEFAAEVVATGFVVVVFKDELIEPDLVVDAVE